jgi:hypothetical protein
MNISGNSQNRKTNKSPNSTSYSGKRASNMSQTDLEGKDPQNKSPSQEKGKFSTAASRRFMKSGGPPGKNIVPKQRNSSNRESANIFDKRD